MSTPDAPQVPFSGTDTPPLLSGVVVHWHNLEPLAGLLEAWPRDPRFELVVVDNGSRPGRLPDLPEGVRGMILDPGMNLGFAGGANRGFEVASAPLLLLLNPDAHPEPGALEALLEGFRAHPEAAGLAPRLFGGDGSPQWAWQLKALPTPGRLSLEGLFLPAAKGPDREPPPGTPVPQPAAAALAVRRQAWDAVGGMDEGFYPAWFEDVDLAHRLADRGETLLYWPDAAFRHGLGSTVPRLGFGLFLWLYHRNRVRYLARHHGDRWAFFGRWATVVGALLRLLALPVRRPRRAQHRRDAAAGLAALARGALGRFEKPRAWAAHYRPPDDDAP